MLAVVFPFACGGWRRRGAGVGGMGRPGWQVPFGGCSRSQDCACGDAVMGSHGCLMGVIWQLQEGALGCVCTVAGVPVPWLHQWAVDHHALCLPWVCIPMNACVGDIHLIMACRGVVWRLQHAQLEHVDGLHHDRPGDPELFCGGVHVTYLAVGRDRC